MILVIRIAGMVKNSKAVEETLHRLRLRRKYAAILLKENNENRKLLVKIRNHVAYGHISDEVLEKLISLRGKSTEGKKIDTNKVIEGLEKKELKSLGIKPFFRLHSPRGGIESKKHFGVGKGVLGDNKKEINTLVKRML